MKVCDPLLCDQDVGWDGVFNFMLMTAFKAYDRYGHLAIWLPYVLVRIRLAIYGLYSGL